MLAFSKRHEQKRIQVFKLVHYRCPGHCPAPPSLQCVDCAGRLALPRFAMMRFIQNNSQPLDWNPHNIRYVFQQMTFQLTLKYRRELTVWLLSFSVLRCKNTVRRDDYSQRFVVFVVLFYCSIKVVPILSVPKYNSNGVRLAWPMNFLIPLVQERRGGYN